MSFICIVSRTFSIERENIEKDLQEKLQVAIQEVEVRLLLIPYLLMAMFA